MTHSDEVKEMLYWRNNSTWFGNNDEYGIYLTKEAPPKAQESFKKWAEYQDSLNGESFDYTLEIC